MARLHGRRLARLDEKLARVLAHRLEQAIPVAAGILLGHHQRLVDKSPEEVGDLAPVHTLARRDLLGGLQREGPGERRPAGETARARLVVNSAWLQLSVALSVCWRSSADRLPAVSTARQSPSRSAI